MLMLYSISVTFTPYTVLQSYMYHGVTQCYMLYSITVLHLHLTQYCRVTCIMVLHDVTQCYMMLHSVTLTLGVLIVYHEKVKTHP